MDDAIGAFRSRDEADPEAQKQALGAYWELSADPEKLSKMSEAELYANGPRLGPELTARLIDERGRLQSPDDLADAQLDSDTLIRIARRAGLDPDSDLPEDQQTLGDLQHRAQQIFASEQRSKGGPLGWEQKQAIVKQLLAEDTLMPAVDRRFFQPGQENAPAGNLSNSAVMLENLLYTRPEGAGLVKLLGAAGEGDSGSNNPPGEPSNEGETADSFQIAAQGGTKAQQPQPSPASGASSGTGEIPGLPDIPKDLNGVPADLVALTYGAASDQEPAIMEAVANTIKNRIGLNVYGLANLNSYDDVIYQWTSGRILRDRNGRPLRDRYGNPRRQGDRPQFNEITGQQMERAYKALTTASGASALRGPKDEDGLTDAYEAADRVYHNQKPDNTIPPEGGRGAVFFHDRSISTPPELAARIKAGDLGELFPAGPNAGMRFYGYTEQGYQKDRIKK